MYIIIQDRLKSERGREAWDQGIQKLKDSWEYKNIEGVQYIWD